MPHPGAFELNVETLGRLVDPAQFANIVIKADPDGRLTRVGDIARVDLGAVDYGANGYLDERPAAPLIIFQRPGSNALATAKRIIDTMQTLAKDFPPGLQYSIIYNPTEFIAESVRELLAAISYSVNNLTLFGLVLAIGIVVDDVIVVVENVERNIRQGMAPREAAHRTMDEVGTALVAIALGRRCSPPRLSSPASRASSSGNSPSPSPPRR